MIRGFNSRDFSRLKRILSVLFRHGFGQFLSSRRFREIPGIKHLPGTREGLNGISLPARARLAIEELGPTFVKLGQVLSCRPDIVPGDYISEFRKLQDEVPPNTWEEVKGIIEDSTERKIGEVFSSIHEAPTASASIAQVHRAVLKDGAEVAVKVQRPDIKGVIESDLKILYFLAKILEDNIDEIGVYTPTLVIREFEKAILQELDFLHEGENAERFRRNMRPLDFVKIPSVYRELSTRQLLVLEMVEGRKLTEDGREDMDRDLVLRRIVDSFVKQIFVDGYFHGDPHPGNIMVLPDDRIAFLDFGLMGNLTGEMKSTLLNLFIAIIFKDHEGLAKTIYRAGEARERVDLSELSGDAKRIIDKYYGRQLSDIHSGMVLMELVEGATKHGLRLPPEYAILSRAFVNTEGIVRELNPDLNFIELLKPMAEKLLTERYSLETVAEEAIRTGYAFSRTLKDLPQQIAQIMLDLERGKLRVTTGNVKMEEIPDEIRGGGLGITLSILAAGLMIGSSILISSGRGNSLALAIIAVLGFFVAGGLSTIVLMRIALSKKEGLLLARRMVESIIKKREKEEER